MVTERWSVPDNANFQTFKDKQLSHKIVGLEIQLDNAVGNNKNILWLY